MDEGRASSIDAFAPFFEGRFSPGLVELQLDAHLAEGSFGGYPNAEGPGSLAICRSPARDQNELGWIIPPVRRGTSQGWIFPTFIKEWSVSGPTIRIRYHHPPILPAGDPVLAVEGSLNVSERALTVTFESHPAAMAFSKQAERLLDLSPDLVTIREKRPKRTIGEG